MKKKILYGILAIGILFIVLNPTPSDFKSFLGSNSNEENIRRTANYLFFSTYQVGVDKFRGVFKNFYYIPYTDEEILKAKHDSLTAADDAMKAAEEAAAQQAEADSVANASAQ